MEEVTLPKTHAQEMPGLLSSFDPRPKTVCCLGFGVYFPTCCGLRASGSPSPYGGVGLAAHQVLGWFGLNLMHKEECCVPIHSRSFTGPQAAGSSCHMGYRLAFALAVPFARNALLSVLFLAVQNFTYPL